MQTAKRPRRRTQAQFANKHDLYERAVQDPDTDVQFFSRTYKRLRDKPAVTMREDFCGTAILSLAWARSHRDREAYGVDLDGPTLEWGKANRMSREKESVANRVTLYQANVLDGMGPRVDLTCALNFSYWIFKTREQLRTYFKVARAGLKSDGMFILDMLGGRDAMIREENETEHDDFTYRWDQEIFDPITHQFLAYIHFDFPDGSTINRAFTYDWRLWTIPEIKELLLEAGFRHVRVLWEKTDEDGEETGVFYEPKRSVENQDVWWTYIVAER